jgi:hypothetical protein
VQLEIPTVSVPREEHSLPALTGSAVGSSAAMENSSGKESTEDVTERGLLMEVRNLSRRLRQAGQKAG